MALPIVIAKNQTASPIMLTRLGIEVPASPATITLTDYATFYEISADPTLNTAVNSGDIVINDGTSDLSAAVGDAYLDATGNFNGPTDSLTANTLVRLAGTSGRYSKSTGISVDDSNNMDLGSGNITTTGNLNASGAIVLPMAANPSQTTNGSVVWDSNDFLLTVGDGSSRKVMVDTTSTQSLSGKTLTDPTLSYTGQTQGDLLYFNGTNWVRLPAGSSGRFLRTNGSAANPTWEVVSGSGDVVGPASSTDNAIARFDGTGGKTLQNTPAEIDDSGNVVFGDSGTSGNRSIGLRDSGGTVNLQINPTTNRTLTLPDVTADLAAVAGQLGGTGASPDIRGIRETSGPTLLTLGTVVDGSDLYRSGSNLVGQRKNNAAGTADPGSTDDSTAGYSIGSWWINSTAAPQKAFMCIDATASAATWRRLDANPRISSSGLWFNSVDDGGRLGMAEHPFRKEASWQANLANVAAISSYGTAAPTTSGAATVQNDGSGKWLQYQSGAVSGNTAGWIAPAFTHVQLRHGPRFWARIKTPAVLAAYRLWIGIFSATPAAADDPAGLHLLAVRWTSTLAGNWRCCAKDGATLNAVDSGYALTASTVYEILIDAYDPTSVDFYIDETLRATITTNLPTTTTDLGMCVIATTTAAVAKQIWVNKALVSAE
jgi:hypothetical protein